MQPATTPEADPTAGVAPAIRHVVPWRVVSVKAGANMRLHVTFVDGTTGEADLSAFLRDPRVTGTVFEAVRDPQYFARAHVALGTVQWPNGAELAPDAMYDAIHDHGRWVVE